MFKTQNSILEILDLTNESIYYRNREIKNLFCDECWAN